MVAGFVEEGEGVASSTNAFNEVHVTARAKTISAAKHHVLKKMSEAIAASRFINATDAVPDLDCDHGAFMVFADEEAQAVRES